MNTLAKSPSLSSISAVPQLMQAITTCSNALMDAFAVSFDKVSGFASNVWSGIQKADLLVDVITRNLVLIEKHLHDLYNEIKKDILSFSSTDIVTMLYDLEQKFTALMVSNNFIYQTFGRLIQGLIDFMKVIMHNTPVFISQNK